MPFAAINAYLDRLPARIAELKLAMADAASIPHMEKGARRSAMRKWTREAQRYSPKKGVVVSPTKLSLLGIGVMRHQVTNGQQQ